MNSKLFFFQLFQQEDSKQCQYIALSIVYFMSVLMVSRYRDIIENNQLTVSASSISAAANEQQQQSQTTHVITPKMLNRSAKVAAQINAAHEKQQQQLRSPLSVSDNGKYHFKKKLFFKTARFLVSLNIHMPCF
jgi:hypothetical protein